MAEKIRIFAFADEASPTLEGQIAAMKRNGLDGLELRNVDGQSVSDLPLAKAREIRRRLADEGLAVWSAGSPIGKIDLLKDDFKAHLDRLRHTVEVARALGAENLRMFSFYIPRDDPERYRDEVLERMGRMLEVSAGSGVALCHENEKGIYGDNAARCLELHRAWPDLAGVFDPANFVQCGQDTAEAWAALKPYIRYMHIKDALADGSVVPAGRGIGNVAAIAADFLARGGSAFTVEPHLTVFDGLSALERSADRAPAARYAYKTPDAAFDAACEAFRELLKGFPLGAQ